MSFNQFFIKISTLALFSFSMFVKILNKVAICHTLYIIEIQICYIFMYMHIAPEPLFYIMNRKSMEIGENFYCFPYSVLTLFYPFLTGLLPFPCYHFIFNWFFKKQFFDIYFSGFFSRLFLYYLLIRAFNYFPR